MTLEGDNGPTGRRDTATDSSPTEVATAPRARGGPALAPGAVVRGYEVIESLGRGGMGEVFVARDTTLGRKIALKVLPSDTAGSSSETTLARRLQREARALAALAHPNVVAVHEVGVFRGRVFIAMEYVEGESLGEWLAARRRTADETIEVFLQAGRGLAAAHAAGLVHRDFKPDNVVIGSAGRVRVLDFGLARRSLTGTDESASAAQPRDPDVPAEEIGPGVEEIITRAGVIVGTPAYMSPEQLRGERTTAQSDQFSFCVSLYEALLGQRPFTATSVPALLRAIKSAEPRTALRAAKIPQRARNAIARGLSANPDDRHPDMNALLAELTSKRAAATVWIVAGLLAIAAAVAVVVALRYFGSREPGVCSTARQTQPLAGVWDAARRNAVRDSFEATGLAYATSAAERASQTLDEYASDWLAMRIEACQATRVRSVQSEEVLDLRMRCLDERLGEFAALTALLAGEPDRELVRRAVEASKGLSAVADCADVEALRERNPLPSDPELRAQILTLRKRLEEAKALEHAGKFGPALEIARQVAEHPAGESYPPIRARGHYHVGVLEDKLGHAEAAEQALGKAIEMAAQSGDDWLLAAASIYLPWVVGVRMARHEEALLLAKSAEVAVARAGIEEMRSKLFDNVASVLAEQGKLEEQLAYDKKSLAIRERALAPEDPDLATSLNNVGVALKNLGRFDEARQYLQRALRIRETALGADHPLTADTVDNLGNLLDVIGDTEESLRLKQRALKIRLGALGDDHVRTGVSYTNVGNVLDELGRLDEALEHHDRALAIWEAIDPEHPRVGIALLNRSAVLGRMRRGDEALAGLQRALGIFEARLSPDHPYIGYALNGIGQARIDAGQPAEAISSLERALAIRSKRPGPQLASTQFQLARALWHSREDRKRAMALAASAWSVCATGPSADELCRDLERWAAEQKISLSR